MAHSIDEVIALIDKEVQCAASWRCGALLQVRTFLEQSGFPTYLDQKQRLELSLVPFVFQEANHDDYNWTEQTAPLHQLEAIFAIDIAVQNGGRTRGDLSGDEFDEYVEFSMEAIDHRFDGG